MELIKENVTVNQTICKGTMQAVIEENIIVPDVKPDMRKILQVDSDVCITDKSVVDGKAVINGRVNMTILYLPDSETESIKSICSFSDFTQNVDSRELSEDVRLLTSAHVEKAEFSMKNSRKLRVGVIVGIDYEAVKENEIEIAVDVSEDDNVQVSKDSVHLQNCIGLIERSFEVKGNCEVQNGQTSINEILKVDTKISDMEYKTIPGRIYLNGTVCSTILYTDGEQCIRSMETEKEFTEVVECEDAGDDTICDIDYSILDTEYEIGEDNDGDRRIVDINVNVNVQIKATENVSVDMISDCYEPFSKTTLLKEEREIDEVVARPVSQNTIREMTEVSQGAPEISGVYDVITRPYITKAQLQKGKLLTEGKIETYILYITDNTESPVYSMKKDIPFSYMLECGVDDESLIPEIKAEVKHVSYNLNVAGEIEIRCILALNANVIRKRTINLISEIITEECDRDSKKGIVVYFVQKGDNLWEIAKHYAVPCDDIMKFNNMTENDKLEIGERLFIPGV